MCLGHHCSHHNGCCDAVDQILCKNTDRHRILRAEEWLNSVDDDFMGLIEPGDLSMDYIMSTLSRSRHDVPGIHLSATEPPFTPLLMELEAIGDVDMLFYGWARLDNADFSLDGMSDNCKRVLHGLGAAPSRGPVHFLRPQEIHSRQYHEDVFTVAAPAVTGVRPPDGHSHPLMRNGIQDLTSHVLENGMQEKEPLWAATVVLGGTRFWFYECIVDGKCFDPIIQMGRCFCTKPTFCAELYAQAMGIPL